MTNEPYSGSNLLSCIGMPASPVIPGINGLERTLVLIPPNARRYVVAEWLTTLRCGEHTILFGRKSANEISFFPPLTD